MARTILAAWRGTHLSHNLRLTLAGVLCVGLSAFAAGPLVANPAEEKKPDRPVAKPDDKAGELLRPTTKPATQPAARAEGKAAKVSADAKELLGKVRDAYKELKSLKLAGTITGDIDVNSQADQHKAEFTASYRAPNEFLHELKEIVSTGGEGKAVDGKPIDAMRIGGTGKKVYVFEPRYKYFYQADAPKDRKIESLGKQVAPLLEQQNLSLLLALIEDAAVELAANVDTVDKVEDVKIGDVSCPAVRIASGKEMLITVAFDPKSNLVRRVVWDYKGLAESKKQQDVKRMLVTVDYTTTEAGVDLSAEPFAWAPPVGARDVTTLADGGSADADDLHGGGSGEQAHKDLIGKPAPDFALKGLDGVEVKLSDLKGQVVLLDFWATWCGPCRTSLPHLDAIYQESKDKGMKGFAIDLREKDDVVKAFVEKTKLGLPVLMDRDGKVAKKFGVSGIPQTVVVDKEGNIKTIVVGSGTHEQVKKAVEEALLK